MKLDSILNKPGDQPPPRRPRLSSSYSKDSQSPSTLDYRQNSASISTPISPSAPSSAHPTTPYGYSTSNQPNSALSATPTSSHSHSVPPPSYQPTPSHYQYYASQPPPTPHEQQQQQQQPPPPPHHHHHHHHHHHQPPYPPPSIPSHSSWNREESTSVSPKTVTSKLSSQPPPPPPPPQLQTYASHPHPSTYSYNSAPPPPTLVYQEPSSMSDRDLSTRQALIKEEPLSTPVGRADPVPPPALQTPIKAKRALTEESSATPAASEPEPQRKKQRLTKIPIWAQPAKKLRPLPKYSANGSTPAVAATTSGPSPTIVDPQVKTQPTFGSNGPLGPFEESFRGDFIPHEELTKQLCDFLFHHVVLNKDMATGRMGESARIEGQLEIEAKIGTIVDRRTDQRLSLPVSSETIVRPDFAVAFESMMTESQHKSFNELLNEALKQSMGPPASGRREGQPKARIKMTYEHRYEVDTFYDLPDDEVSNLSTALQTIIKQSPNHKPKLRVTRDKKTGKVLAKIVKARISDMHVYSPSTTFDWRVSVNLEANWNGDLDALVRAAEESGIKSNPDRNKDRMSYAHLFCQIDLTQVKTQTSRGLSKITHELEVELDSSTVREQGNLVINEKDNQYQELVKAFVDNVRILIRGVQ